MKKIVCSLFLLILFLSFPHVLLCEVTEAILIGNLKDAKTNSQKIKANKQLLYYYINLKDYESSIPIANELLNFKLSKKQKYNVYYNLAKSYLKLSKTEKALEVGQEAQYLYPKKLETKLLLGNIYKNNGLNELAIVKFKEALETDDDNIEALTNLGNIYNMQENYKLSLEYFEKAQKERLQNNKDLCGDDYINMAISAREIGKIEQAQYILENIKEKNKTSSLLLSDIYQTKQDFGNAIKELVPFAYQEQTDIEIYCKLAQLYLLSGQFEEAKNLLLYFKSKNNEKVEAIDLLLVEAYHNIYKNKERELKELNKILKYTDSEYIKKIIEKIIIFEKK